MNSSDLALLATLGAIDCGASRTEEIAACARSAAPLDWQPTGDVIAAAIESGIGHGWLAMVAEGSATGYRLTASGREKIVALLEKPIPGAGGGPVRAAMSIKLSLLHYLPQPSRTAACFELAYLYRDLIAVCGRPQGSRPLQEYGHGLACEEVRLRSELAWLDAMTLWRSLAQAAE